MPDAHPTDASARPTLTQRSSRVTQVVATARRLLESEGRDALTMRRLAEEIGIKAPSLYKHLPDKAALEAALVEDALAEVGAALHASLDDAGVTSPVDALLGTYRAYGTTNPNLYRLATAGTLPRAALPEGLEEWAGNPFFRATGEPHRAQALWAFAHGMVVLEIDGRFVDVSQLDETWRAGAEAFAQPARTGA